jgi:hypothetical protein
MAKKKYEFRPDNLNSDLLSKLYLTKKQRLSLLKWTLYGLVLLVFSVLQDVILSRVDIFGATTDLVPCAILLICVLQGTEKGSVFALVAAACYQFSGTAPGYHVIVLLPAVGIFATMARQSYLRKTKSSDILCAIAAVLVYELSLFVICLFAGLTGANRFFTYFLTALLSLALIPALYPVVALIDKVGGETWTE